MDAKPSRRSGLVFIALLVGLGVIAAVTFDDVFYRGPEIEVVVALDVCANPEIILDGVLWETKDRVPTDMKGAGAEVAGVFQTNGGTAAHFTSFDGRVDLRYRAVVSNGGFSARPCLL